MIRYGKTTQTAIAALSRLAEVYDQGRTTVSSAQIATSRNLPKPLIAKLLTILSQAGLVSGSPGPGGGYTLARPPHLISLYDVVNLFEHPEDTVTCPFGPGYCGNNEPCPLHDKLVALNETIVRFLRDTTFDLFVPAKN